MSAAACHSSFGGHRATTAPVNTGFALRSAEVNILGQLAVPLASLLVVFSLSLSWFGPMLDHHFAERHPGHRHIYLGAAAGAHSHSYEGVHSHDSRELLRAMTGDAPTGDSSGVVVLSPSDGIGHGAAQLIVPATVDTLRSGADENGGLLTPRLPGDSRPTGASVSPPTRPPSV